MFNSDKGLLQSSELLMIYNDKTWIRIRSLSLLHNILSSNFFTFNRWKRLCYLQFQTPPLSPLACFLRFCLQKQQISHKILSAWVILAIRNLRVKELVSLATKITCWVNTCAGYKCCTLIVELINLVTPVYNLIPCILIVVAITVCSIPEVKK